MMRLPFPHLQIVPLQSLYLDVVDDVQRVSAMLECLTTEGVLRNPPILTRRGRKGRQYAVLDGAECVVALRRLNIPYILAQVVEPGCGMTPRALRVNYPLTELMNGKSLIEKNHALERWLQARLIDRSIRCYEEATILFDE